MATRRILFPLRTSVELFSDPRSPDAVTKAKEAAVLYDELIFEPGLLDVTITPQGGSSIWIPPEQMTDALLARSRRPAVGDPMTLAIGKQDAPGVPAEEMHVMVSGQISNTYIAEFHTGILDELKAFDPEWVKTIDIGGEAHPGRVGEPVYEAIRHRNFSDFGDKELMPDVESFLRTYISKSFNRDAIVATDLAASFPTTPLFRPMVDRHGVNPDYAGSEALSIIAGNVGELPWEAVVEFRDHHGSQEARERLREFERLASEADPQDAYDFLKSVSLEVNRGFRAAIEALAPSLPEELAKQVLLNAVATASVIGAPVAAAAGLTSALSEWREYSRSWIAAVMVLTR